MTDSTGMFQHATYTIPNFAEGYCTDDNARALLLTVLLEELGLDGVLQIASFHPQYRFEGSAEDEIADYSNRSPYPTLHLLREASIERAVAAFPDAAAIYERNIETLRRLGHAGWRKLMVADPG